VKPDQAPPEPRQEDGGLSPQKQPLKGSSTVLGLKLLPGERVIYFRKIDGSPTLVILGLFGLALLLMGLVGVRAAVGHDGVDAGMLVGSLVMALVGLGLVVVAVAGARRTSSQAQVVTTLRLIEVSGPGARRGVSLDDVWDLRAQRENAHLLTMAASALSDTETSTMAPSYWSGATRILMMDGGFSLRSPEPEVLGPFLARCVQVSGFVDRCAEVHYEP
jgi:hypothetical protein